jgi:ABC-type polysaccharide/polyol phosphate export permease
MFQVRVNKTKTQSFIAMLAVVYHSIVRSARSGHRNAIVALLLNMMQGVMLVGMFFLFFRVLGMRSSPIRGDMLLFLITGVFLFLTHIKAVKEVAGAGSSTSAMMLHGPMNTIIAIIAAAMACLYQQFLTLVFVLGIYHAAFAPVVIDDPIPAFGFFLLAWFTGCTMGLLFLALRPWFPKFTTILMQLYRRSNMIFSGKMVVVNTMPAHLLPFFEWNPLFHTIDQIRGAVFLHYNPHVTSTTYPLYLALVCLMIGLMGEFFSRQHASVSWAAGR